MENTSPIRIWAIAPAPIAILTADYTFDGISIYQKQIQAVELTDQQNLWLEFDAVVTEATVPAYSNSGST